jgi:hypothetical protein
LRWQQIWAKKTKGKEEEMKVEYSFSLIIEGLKGKIVKYGKLEDSRSHVVDEG